MKSHLWKLRFPASLSKQQKCWFVWNLDHPQESLAWSAQFNGHFITKPAEFHLIFRHHRAAISDDSRPWGKRIFQPQGPASPAIGELIAKICRRTSDSRVFFFWRWQYSIWQYMTVNVVSQMISHHQQSFLVGYLGTARICEDWCNMNPKWLVSGMVHVQTALRGSWPAETDHRGASHRNIIERSGACSIASA